MRRATKPDHRLPSPFTAGLTNFVAGLLTAPPSADYQSPSPILGEGRGEGFRSWPPIACLVGAGAALLAVLLVAPGCSKAIGQPASAPVAELARVQGASPNSDPRSLTSDSDLTRIQILPPDKTTGELPAQRIDLGTVRQGETLRRTIIIENRTSDPTTIDRFEASCECLTLKPLPMTIKAGRDARAEIVADESRERDFHGTLAIHVSAFGVRNKLLTMQALLRVVPNAQ